MAVDRSNIPDHGSKPFEFETSIVHWELGELQNYTCRNCIFLSVSTSKMEISLSAAAARNCPSLGWNLTCAVPPCVYYFTIENHRTPRCNKKDNFCC